MKRSQGTFRVLIYGRGFNWMLVSERDGQLFKILARGTYRDVLDAAGLLQVHIDNFNILPSVQWYRKAS